MAYFQRKQNQESEQPEKLFRVPLRQDDEDDGLQDWQDDPIMPEEDEEIISRRDKLKMLFGVGDFFGVLIGTVLILLLVAVLISLINWLVADVTQFLDVWCQ